MKQRPILFSAPMVRALLAGTKTQTRRIVKDTGLYAIDANIHGEEVAKRELAAFATRSPYGQPGDRLWVKETWNVGVVTGRWTGVHYAAGGEKEIPATHPGWAKWWNRARKGWIPSLFMSLWASRLTLEITAVRVERLQDISEADAVAEGIESAYYGGNSSPVWRDYSQTRCDKAEWFSSPVDSYRSLWKSLNGPGSWAANPFVWCVSFRRVEQDGKEGA